MSRVRLTATGLVILFALLISPTAHATERFAYEAFPAPGSELEETGNLYVMEEGQEPQPLELWGQNPSVDTRSRLVAYYQDEKIYITNYKGSAVYEAIDISPAAAASPQWVPGRGLVLDGLGAVIAIDYSRPEVPALHLINWPGRQWAPAASPDGDKIAFLSEMSPEGELLEWPAIYMTNLDGSEPVRLTNPELLSPVGAPTFSPDGSRLVFSAFGEFNEWEQGDLVSMAIAGGGLIQVTNIPNGIAWEPDWLPDGSIVFTEEHWNTGDLEFLKVPAEGGQLVSMHAPFTNGEFGFHISGRQPTHWGPLTIASSDLATQLLNLYAPTLRYDTTETYRAIAINSILETYSGTEPEDSNKLFDGEGTVIQYANPVLNEKFNRIRLVPDGVPYFGPATYIFAKESDRLDERNGSYAEDAAVWNEMTWYANRVYGRTVFSEGHWWLQYWFWYYYNDFNLLGFGDHEGDWEMIQIQLDEYGNPQLATYSQHGDSEADTCDFEILDWTVGRVANISPVVYVATGTHASFIRPGLAIGSFPYDRADGEGYVSRTRLFNVQDPLWQKEFAWPGRWGSSLGEGKSPMAPISQGDKWDHPGVFAEQAESCPREEAGSPLARPKDASAIEGSPQLPRRPDIEAQLEGDTMFVRFHLPGDPRTRKGIEVAILARDAEITPTKRTAWRPRGSLRIPLPNSGDSYKVVARTLSTSGAGSPIKAINVRGATVDTVSRVQGRRAPDIVIPNPVRHSDGYELRLAARLGPGPESAFRRRLRRARQISRRLQNAPTPRVSRSLRGAPATLLDGE